MRFYCLVVALTLLAALASDSWGQSKRIPQPQTQPPQQQTAPEQRGTEKSPMIVKFLPTQETEDKAKTEAKDHEEKRQFDIDTLWLSKATVAIIFLQLLIFGAQAYFLLGTLKVTATVATAADLSARAAIALQLPIIRIRLQPLAYAKDLQGPIETENCYVDYVDVLNLGAMKASPKEILYGWTVGEALPPKPTYTSANKFPHNSILEPDSANHVRTLLTGVHLLRDGEWSKISRGNYLWFYCEIIYEDFMGERHSHGFCWLWGYDGEGMNWRTSNAAAYNQKT
jgi:hypothetical protein